MENPNLIRVGLRVSKKIKDYFEKKSYETGVPQSSLMALALEEYIDQKEVANAFSKLEELKKQESFSLPFNLIIGINKQKMQPKKLTKKECLK